MNKLYKGLFPHYDLKFSATYTCMICYPSTLHSTNLQQLFCVLSKQNKYRKHLTAKSALPLPIFTVALLTIK